MSDRDASFDTFLSKKFPVLGSNGTANVPWALVELHAPQAWSNHGQTVQRLAERGGLSWEELRYVLLDQNWRHTFKGDHRLAVLELVAAFEKCCPVCKRPTSEAVNG